MRESEGDVATALGAGRKADIEDLQPIKTNPPKSPFGDSPLQITVLAAITRTLALTGHVPPSRRNSRSCRDTQQLRLGHRLISLTSSRTGTPADASSI